MKIQPVSNAVKNHSKIFKKGVAMAAGVALGLAAVSAGYSKINQNRDEVVLTMQSGKDFNNLNSLEKQGKTKHWFRAKNGPDKGSKFYRDSEYDFFGNYKG